MALERGLELDVVVLKEVYTTLGLKHAWVFPREAALSVCQA